VTAKDSAKTHCPKGHPYDEANTWVSPKGWRRCRRCRREAESSRRYARTEKGKALHKIYMNNYRRAHPEKVKEWNRRSLLKRQYGLTTKGYAQMQEDQDGLCAICYRVPATHIDHDHATGKVRGLLCENCNRGLGIFQDDPEALAFAADYVRGVA
jgi:recombination endonuclease VII